MNDQKKTALGAGTPESGWTGIQAAGFTPRHDDNMSTDERQGVMLLQGKSLIGKRLTRGQAIRAKCLDCCCGQLKEIRLCPCVDCPLYGYRLGYEEQVCDESLKTSVMGKKGEYATFF